MKQGDLITSCKEESRKIIAKINSHTANSGSATIVYTVLRDLIEVVPSKYREELVKDIAHHVLKPDSYGAKPTKGKWDHAHSPIWFMNQLTLAYPFEAVSWGLGRSPDETTLGEAEFDLPDGSTCGLVVNFESKEMQISDDMPQKYQDALFGLATRYDFEIEWCTWAKYEES